MKVCALIVSNKTDRAQISDASFCHFSSLFAIAVQKSRPLRLPRFFLRVQIIGLRVRVGVRWTVGQRLAATLPHRLVHKQGSARA